MCHADHVPIKELDVLIATERENDKKKCIEKEKEHDMKNKNEANRSPPALRASSEDYEYDECEDDDEIICTEEDSMASECPSDFDEWMKWNKKKARLKGHAKSYSDCDSEDYEMSSSQKDSIPSDFDDCKKKTVRHKVKHKSYSD